MGKEVKFIMIFCGFLSLCCNTKASNITDKKVLYLNSYAPTYSWGDSVADGVLKTFKLRKDIILFVEYLDTKRFGKQYFENYYSLFSEKYKNTKFDLVLTSDNNALNFILLYGDKIAPKKPIIFCGVNNPKDYNLEEHNIYGIKEGVDLNSVIKLTQKVIPGINKLYFIGDNTETSKVNLEYAKKLEKNYTNNIEFVFITNVFLDSLHKLVQNFDKGNAIVLHDIFQNPNYQPVNPDLALEKTAELASVPLFMDSETSFGKGIIGGILNSGSKHGAEAARLALIFLDNPNFKPQHKVSLPTDNYYFDYKVMQKYNIDATLIPKNSTVINLPSNPAMKYFKYILLAFLLFAGLIIFITFLIIINNRRKKAEQIVKQKLNEIQLQNAKLEDANQLFNKMNLKLEKANENFIKMNKDLAIAKNKSEESDRLKSAFLANMSHEIRTPLNAIVGFSALFKDEGISKDEHPRFATLIEKNSENLLKLIDDILDISKTEAGQLKLNFSFVLVNNILEDLILNFSNNKNKSNVSIFINEHSHTDELCIKTDALRIQQIFNNLISNALKFTHSGSIEIGYKEEIASNKIVFYVKDTGIGIEKEDIDKVFDRFWKTEEKNGYLNPGTGLGLSISKKICELLGGDMWVESEMSVGTTFYFSHPANIRKISRMDVPHNSQYNNIEYNLSGKKIALVEDEENNMELLFQLLKNTEAELQMFNNGMEIYEYIYSEKYPMPDIIIMDIKMPVMGGIEATQKIKKKHPNLPIIAQTAYAAKNEIIQIKSIGFNEYITKPLKKELLFSLISKCLNKPK